MEGIDKPHEYSYIANSNLVLQSTERSRDLGPSSDVFSLRSKFTSKELTKTFGDRAYQVKPADLVKLKKEAESKKRKNASDIVGPSKRLNYGVGSTSVLTANIDSSYTPLSTETKNVYDVFLSSLQGVLTDQPYDVLRSVSEELLHVLKDEETSMNSKQQQVQQILQDAALHKVGSEHFSRFYNLSQKLTDYGVNKREETEGPKEEEWIPVTFDEEEGDGEKEDDEEGVEFTDNIGVAVFDDDDHEMLFNMLDSDHVDNEIASALHMHTKTTTKDTEDTFIHPRVADSHWVQRQLSPYYADAEECAQIAEKIITILQSEDDFRAVENELVLLLGHERFDIVKLFLKNRFHINLGIMLSKSADDAERIDVRNRLMTDSRYTDALTMLEGTRTTIPTQIQSRTTTITPETQPSTTAFWLAPPKVLDLQALSEASTHIIPSECKLPSNSQIIMQKGYQEVHVPPARAAPVGEVDKTVFIESLPSWAQMGFQGMRSLNRIQSRIYDTAFLSNNNMLVCAPTGAGKTNCAMLTIMREIGLHRVPKTHSTATNMRVEGVDHENSPGIALEDFKIVYIAPMKSLVQEMVLNFSNRLKKYGVTVRELSGDAQLSRAALAETQIIVTTPEKWDIVTRKEGERSVLGSVRLVIMDEIHLLHDSRGPVLETIVARTMRYSEQTQTHIRVVGLSATLPNYEDVALFLRVQPDNGMFFFDNSYRPCPLHQQFIGITHKKAHKRAQMQNEICYTKVSEQAGKNQTLVFTHSRKDTVATARYIRDCAVDDGSISKYVEEGSGRHQLLLTEAGNVEHPALKELLPYGLAFHHAGMTRNDRTLVEELFAAQHVQVLVSTATLAWGVNLPAHSVVIKGTQVYSPEQGRWVELSPQDVTQMVGRAGRPQYDSYGEGILITSQQELQFYLSLLNTQLPVESQLLTKLVDAVNAEVVNGVINNVNDGVDWMHYTYLYVRMLRNPILYGVSIDDIEKDPELRAYCMNLIHSALIMLDKHGLAQYDRKSGTVTSTELGRVASYYYLSYQSIGLYNEALKPAMTDIDILRVFALSNEFKLVAVREEEKIELAKLIDKVPIPVKESVEDHLCKINVLLQAYLSNLSLSGFALASDMVYITQSAGRIFRALFELVLRRGWASATLKLLSYCKMISQRMWSAQTPLRQIPSVPTELVHRLENKDLTWDRVCELDEHALGELLRAPKLGKKLQRWVHQVPKVDIRGHVQPVTRSVVRVVLTMMCDFMWDDLIHGASQGFWVWVEDVDGETILHHEFVTLRRKHTSKEHVVSFILPVFDPLPPHYYVRIVSDKWIGCEATLPISFKHLLLPERFAPLTELLDLQPLPVSEVGSVIAMKYLATTYPHLTHFNAVQSQVFNSIYKRDDHVLVCAPSGSGKTLLAELAILRLWSQKQAELRVKDQSRLKDNEEEEDDDEESIRVVYIVPYQVQAQAVFTKWNQGLCSLLTWDACVLCGDIGSDMEMAARSEVIISTAEYWDMVSRRWHNRDFIKQVKLVIVDDLHMIGSNGVGSCVSSDSNLGIDGTLFESVITRTKYMASQLQQPIRILGLSASIANGKNIADWISTKHAYYLHPNNRSVPLQTYIRPLDLESHEGRQLAAYRRIYQDILKFSPQSPVLLYTSGSGHCYQLARELVKLVECGKHELLAMRRKELSNCGMSSEDVEKMVGVIGEVFDNDIHGNHPLFLRVNDDALAPHLTHCSEALSELIVMGVGVYHAGLTSVERRVVAHLHTIGAIQVVVADNSLCWEVNSIDTLRGNLVAVVDTQYYDGSSGTYADISIANVAEMIGQALPPRGVLNAHIYGYNQHVKGVAVVYVHTPRANYYRKFLLEPYPLESHFDQRIHTHLNSEIATGRVDNMQHAVDYTTWTLFYRRLKQNPNYYNLTGVSGAAISEHLSELVENAVNDLAQSGCVELSDDGSLSPLNLGRISDYYNIQYETMELFANTLTERIAVRDLIWLVCNSSECEQVVYVRAREEAALATLAQHLPLPLPSSTTNTTSTDDYAYSTPAAKCHVLLQAHLSRIPLIASTQADTVAAVAASTRVIAAIVDVVSSSRWLNAVIGAVELTQMLNAAAWANASPLLQIPHFNKELVEVANKMDVKTVGDVADMEDEDRAALFKNLSRKQIGAIAKFCNAYPQVEVQWQVLGDVRAGQQGSIGVIIDRTPEEDDEDEEEWDDSLVVEQGKRESWWVVVGDKKNKVWGVKRIWIRERKNKVRVNFIPEVVGTHELSLYVMCDRFIGADQEFPLSIQVDEAGDDNDDESEMDD